MLDLVTYDNRHLYTAALNQMFCLRHRHFVERLGWRNLAKSDGLERDQFDTPHSFYLLMFDEDETSVIGAHRLLRTTEPHLMSEVFSHICTRGVVRGPKVMEISRSFVDEDNIPKNRLREISSNFLNGLREFLIAAQIEHITGIVPIGMLGMHLREGVRATPLGPPVEMDGAHYVPIVCPVDRIPTNDADGVTGQSKRLVRYLAPRAIDFSVISTEPVSMPTTLQ